MSYILTTDQSLDLTYFYNKSMLTTDFCEQVIELTTDRRTHLTVTTDITDRQN